MKSIFNHNDYRSYLIDILGDRGRRTGLKSKLARQINVHNSYLSLVLNGQSSLSLEQAERLSEYLGHSELETQGMLSLVLMDRAGTSTLKDKFYKQFRSYAKESEELSEKFRDRKKVPEAIARIYFSHWIYSAVCVLVSIPEFDNFEALSNGIAYPKEKLRDVVKFLLDNELILENEGRYRPGFRHVGQGKGENEFANQVNYRSLAINKMHNRNDQSIHYSAVMSMSRKTAKKMRKALLKTIEECTNEVIKSEEEQALVMNVDFFNLLED